MINEKLNNDNWKVKLEDADALPEYALQKKHAAWENLYDKLHKKQQPKILWYWIAAACVITAIIVISFMQQPDKNNVAIRTSIKTQLQQNTVAQQTTQQLSIKKTNTTFKVVKNKSINTNINKLIKPADNKYEIVIAESPVLQRNELADIKTELPIIKDSTIQATAAIAPKKMKIVHANELDDDGTNINMVQNRVPSRLKFLNQDIYTDYTLSAPASGFGIIKHKTSPSN